MQSQQTNTTHADSIYMTIIADSGSTKTEWIIGELSVNTKGINPVRDSKEEILEVIGTELMPQILSALHTFSQEEITDIHFYGAGCIEPFLHNVRFALAELFPYAQIQVHSDLLGAARALCGKEEGIACILGTGSNSCLCKEGEIIQNTSPLGYILGDEGSGAVLGRTLLSEMLKGNLKDLWEPFKEHFGLEISDIINKVYRQPQANRFLASLVPFIKANSWHPAIQDMLIGEFTRFLQRNVIPYDRPDLPINFVGGVANNFTEEITAACKACGLIIGKIIARPAIEMQKYHFYVI